MKKLAKEEREAFLYPSMTLQQQAAVTVSETKREQQQQEEERGKSISKGVRSLTAQNIGTSTLAFIFVAALIRFLPAIQYGVYSAVSVSVSIAAAFTTFGLQYASARYVSILKGRKGSEAALAARKIVFLSLIFSSAITVLFGLFSPSLSLFFTKSTSFTFVFLLGAMWVFSSSISLIFQGIVQGLKKYELLARVLLATRAIMVAFTIISLVIYANVSLAVIAWIAYSVMIVGWTCVSASKELGRKAGSMEAKKSAQGEVMLVNYSTILRYSIPLGLAGILSVISQNSDLIVVGGYLAPTSLGVYNAAVTISTFLTFVSLTPLVTALLPEASSSQRNYSEISNGLRLAIRYVFLAVLPASLLVAGVSPQLLVIFSGRESYLAGSPSLELIATFYVFFGIQTVILPVLQALGRTIQVLTITALMVGTELTTSLTLVPHFGLIGAASARVLSAVLGMGAGLWCIRRFLRPGGRRFYPKAILSAVLPFSLIFCLSNFFYHGELSIIPYTLIGVCIFFICIRKLKLLSSEDMILLRHILPSRFSRILEYL